MIARYIGGRDVFRFFARNSATDRHHSA
jgi:hypothetical protein